MVMVASASATERRSRMRLINHALEQEGSMRLINNMHLITRVYGMQRAWTSKFKHGRLYLKSVTPFMAIQRLRMLNLHVHPVVYHIHTR